MARVKRGVTAHAKHKKVLKAARGYYGARSRLISGQTGRRKVAAIRLHRPQTEEAQFPRALDPAYQRRCPRTRADYGRFINGLNNLGIEVDRKMLSDIAIKDPEASRRWSIRRRRLLPRRLPRKTRLPRRRRRLEDTCPGTPSPSCQARLRNGGGGHAGAASGMVRPSMLGSWLAAAKRG